jgi:hypothetical protein
VTTVCQGRKRTYGKSAVSAPGYLDPAYDAMVEAWFDSPEDLNAFFLSDNFVNIVDPDHVNFLDVPAAVRLVTEETVVV